jgi:hypothetical protein
VGCVVATACHKGLACLLLIGMRCHLRDAFIDFGGFE